MRFSGLLAVFLVWMFSMEARAFDWDIQRIDGRDYVSVAKIAEFYNLPRDAAPTNRQIYLSRGSRSLTARADSRDFDINGVRYVLSFPVLERNGQFWVSRMDLGKTIEPAFRPENIQGLKPFSLVVLDPGHGGQDKGAASPYEFEKNFALDVARRVRNELQQAGLRVFMTRNNDSFVELQDRAAMANAKQNCIFVSIHFNATDTNPDASGLEIYSITPRGSPSTEYDTLLVRDMVQEYGNTNEVQSFALSHTIFHSLRGADLDMADRGVKRARFAVLRLTKMPAVLIEGGFLTNSGDAKRVASTAWRNQYAKAIARGILAYRKLVETNLAPPTMTEYRNGTANVISAATPAPRPVTTPAPAPVNSINLRDLPQ